MGQFSMEISYATGSVLSENQQRLAWAAFKNMLRAAARDLLWAFLNLIAMPFRVWKPLLQTFLILFVVGLVV